MATFETKERQALYALFTVDEHEIREGSTSRDGKKVQWFTYIRREAIIERLDSIFFGEWESGFINPMQPYTRHDTHVDCAMHLTIRGMRREYNGSQKLNYDRKAQKYTTGENDEKGAATDAFKRVASQWGIGLYLQQSPQIWTENYKDDNGNIDWKKKDRVQNDAISQVSKWLKSLGADGNALRSDDSDNTDDLDSTTGNGSQSNTVHPDFTPPPASGNSQQGSGKKELTWEEQVFAATAFLYTNPKHQTNSINALLKNAVISDKDKPVVSILAILFHRAKSDFGMDESECKELLGSQVEGTVSDYMKSVNGSYEAAWKVIQSSQKKADDTEYSLPPTGTDDIPF